MIVNQFYDKGVKGALSLSFKTETAFFMLYFKFTSKVVRFYFYYFNVLQVEIFRA